MVIAPFLAHAPLHAIALSSDNQHYVNFGASARLQVDFTPQPRPLIQLLDTPPTYCRTTGLIHPYEVRHLTISEIKLMSSFPREFKLEGRFTEKWARVGNSVPPLFMKALAQHIRFNLLEANQSAGGNTE
jgi:site-specific DNA-cytosine methylase